MASEPRRSVLTGLLTFATVCLLEAASVAAMFTDLPVGPMIDLLLAFAFHLGAAVVVSYGFWGPWDFRYADHKNWAAVGFVLVLAIPVYGLLGYAGAFAAVHLRRRYHARGGDVINQFERYIAYQPDIEARLHEMPLMPLVDPSRANDRVERLKDVAPLIDIIKSGSPEMKRGAIFSLGRLERKTAVRILREALKDIDRQSQFYVAGQLSNIEKELSDHIIHTRRRLELEPENVELQVQLARHNHEYVESGLLDPSVAVYFRRQALELCEKALAKEPNRVDVLMTLAELRHGSGEHTQSIDAYRQVLAKEPKNAAARVGLAHGYFEVRDLGNLQATLEELRTQGELPPELTDVVTFWEAARA